MIDKRQKQYDTSIFSDMRVTLLRITLRGIFVLVAVNLIGIGLLGLSQGANLSLRNIVLSFLPVIKLAIASVLLIKFPKVHYDMLLCSDRATRSTLCNNTLAAYLLVISILLGSSQQLFSLAVGASELAVFTGGFVAISIPLLLLFEDIKKARASGILIYILAFLDFTVYLVLQQHSNMKVVLLSWLSHLGLCALVLIVTLITKYFVRKIIQGYEAKLNSTESYRTVAETDALTSLSNRRALDIDTAIITHLGRRNVAVAMFDIDKFKRFNDDYGHQVGDYVLSSVGKLARTIGNTPLCEAYRYGGEEILMIFIDRPINEVIRQIELFRSAVANIKIPGADNTHITISAGLISSELPNLLEFNLQEEKLLDAGSAIMLNLIHKADDNLYIAKNTGRNKLVTGYTTLTANKKSKAKE